MDCTHIFVITKGYNSKDATVCVYNAEGILEYSSDMMLKETPDIKSTGGVDSVTREDVVRYITRNCLEFDVAMSTPMFGARK